MPEIVRWAALAICLASAAQGQTVASDYAAYRQAMLAQGLAPVVPASTDFAAGYIYRLERTSDGRQVVRTVCEQAFSSPPRVTEQFRIPQQKVRSQSLSFAVKFLPGVLAKAVEAAFGGNASRSGSASISFDNVRAYEIAAPVSRNPVTGAIVQRDFDRLCLANLELIELDEAKRFKDKLFLVVRALSADDLTYGFDGSGSVSAKASAGLATMGSADVGWRAQASSKQAFHLQKKNAARPIYFAADVVQIESLSRLGHVANTADVEASERKAEERDLAPLARTDIR